jgi:chromate transporter
VLSLGQLLPGPNIVSMALIIGDRFLGWRWPPHASASSGAMRAPCAPSPPAWRR